MDILIDDFERLEISNLLSSVITIQKVWKGYYVRKKLMSLSDDISKKLLKKFIRTYVDLLNKEKEFNNILTKKKIRYSNLPSHISENLVKFVIAKKYHIMPSWYTKKGDLAIDNKITKFIKIEVKGSIILANGPSSYGPSEHWDQIYFVDMEEIHDMKFKVYRVNLADTSEKWKSIPVNKNQTYHDQCKQGRRPRFNFKVLQDHLGDFCQLIFNGSIYDL